MTPDKCPKCGARKVSGFIIVTFACDTWVSQEGDAVEEGRECLTRQRDQLLGWKASAQSILNEWHDVWVTLGKPGPAGRSMALCVLEQWRRMKAAGDRLSGIVGQKGDPQHWVDETECDAAVDGWTQAKEAQQ